MNESLQKALAALIDKLTTTITDVGSTVANQIPELVNQMIGFQIMKYWIWVGVEAAILIILPLVIYWTIGIVGNRIVSHEEALEAEKARRRNCNEDGSWGWCLTLGIIWAAAGISIVMDTIQLVKLYHFPLVWILDYLKDLTAK